MCKTYIVADWHKWQPILANFWHMYMVADLGRCLSLWQPIFGQFLADFCRLQKTVDCRSLIKELHQVFNSLLKLHQTFNKTISVSYLILPPKKKTCSSKLLDQPMFGRNLTNNFEYQKILNSNFEFEYRYNNRTYSSSYTRSNNEFFRIFSS